MVVDSGSGCVLAKIFVKESRQCLRSVMADPQREIGTHTSSFKVLLSTGDMPYLGIMPIWTSQKR